MQSKKWASPPNLRLRPALGNGRVQREGTECGDRRAALARPNHGRIVPGRLISPPLWGESSGLTQRLRARGLGEDELVVARQLLRVKAKRTPFAGRLTMTTPGLV
jgi:hypothetical protein